MAAHLSLALLGPFQVTLDGKPLKGFRSDKVRALLFYLAVERDYPHNRLALAELLWPDYLTQAALASLRQALSNLRQVAGDRFADPPFLITNQEMVQFNPASDHWLDVAAFEQLLVESRQWQAAPGEQSGTPKIQAAIPSLQSAVRLYRGCFLKEFALADSAPFEEWTLVKREQIDRGMREALHRLALALEQRGEYAEALLYGRRLVDLEPWSEEAQRQLIRLLALSGKRSEALAQYEACRRLLARELGVTPDQDTSRLYEQIKSGNPLPAERAPGRQDEGPAEGASLYLSSGRQAGTFQAVKLQFSNPQATFAGRKAELEALDRHLEQALAGQGRVVFVCGEAGSGKTALAREFARRAMQAHPDLVAAFGRSDLYAEVGDAYAPFVEILQLLAGDINALQAGGALSPEHAGRLWEAWPQAAMALVIAGPDLIERFLPGEGMLKRATTYARQGSGRQGQYQAQLQRRAERGPASLDQAGLFEQFTHVLQTLARSRPLVLALDDLQWAERGSLGLLFHLGRRLGGSRILVAGVYRSGEGEAPAAAEAGKGTVSALESLVNEFQGDFGEIHIDLAQAEGRQFVEDLLDVEAKGVGQDFRDGLYQQTGGQALFTVELLRGLQERGDLAMEAEGVWRPGPGLDWGPLPARVEAVLAERANQLRPEWQALLAAASVEGEEFSAQVAARAAGLTAQEAMGALSGPLSREQALVRAEGQRWLVQAGRPGRQGVARYRFRQGLVQRYFYSRLDEVERGRLHAAVGEALEAVYGGCEEMEAELAAQLARHREAAGLGGTLER